MSEMEIEGNINKKQGTLYVREDVRNILGDKIKMLPDANVVLMYPKGKDYHSIIRSVEVLIGDLKIRAENAEKEGE